MATPFSAAIVLAAICLLLFLLMKAIFNQTKIFSVPNQLPLIPKVPGLPLIGNLLQLIERKPQKTFKKWAEIYGPIYSIKLGSSELIVINSTNVAKEAMVTRFSSISTRQMSYGLEILSHNQCMVATSDYNHFHKTMKKHIMTSLLGSTAQRRNRSIRETMLENVVNSFNTHVKSSPLEAVNFREMFVYELFGLALKQVVGRAIESLYVEELGTTLSRMELFHVLVMDLVEGSIIMDWRDFFPSLKWVPNKKVEKILGNLHFRRQAVMKAMLTEHKKRVMVGEETNSYIDILLAEANTMTEAQLLVLLWEPIIESTDTTLNTTEWAIFELAKAPKFQARLYKEIEAVCGSNEVTEDDLYKLPYLMAVFHETLRMHSPLPVIPIRCVHEDTQIGGYHVPTGSKILINLHGCNMDNNQWENAEEWNPERFLDEKYDVHDLYKTMSLGAGKRVCAGALQAMLIACTSIGRLVQQFEWMLKPGDEDDVDTVELTTHKLHPMYVIIKPRGDQTC